MARTAGKKKGRIAEDVGEPAKKRMRGGNNEDSPRTDRLRAGTGRRGKKTSAIKALAEEKWARRPVAARSHAPGARRRKSVCLRVFVSRLRNVEIVGRAGERSACRDIGNRPNAVLSLDDVFCGKVRAVSR